MSRDRIVSARLTAEEKAAIDALGGAAKVLREAAAQPRGPLPLSSAGLWPLYARTINGVGTGASSVLWEDGTVGPQWPPAGAKLRGSVLHSLIAEARPDGKTA